jgi:hypothetical protein
MVNFSAFEEPYSLQNPDGSASMTFFKINDHQTIELFPKRQAGTDRLNHISFKTSMIGNRQGKTEISPDLAE